MKVVIAIEVGDVLLTPIVSLEEYERQVTKFIITQTSQWSVLMTSTTWNDKLTDLQDSVLSGKESEFEQILKNEYPNQLSLLLQILRQLHAILQSVNVEILYFTNNNCGWIDFATPYVNKFQKGKFDLSLIQSELVRLCNNNTYPLPGLWRSILSSIKNLDTTDRVLILGSTKFNPQLTPSVLDAVSASWCNPFTSIFLMNFYCLCFYLLVLCHLTHCRNHTSYGKSHLRTSLQDVCYFNS